MKRRLTGILTLAAAAALLAGCSTTAADAPKETTAPTTQAAIAESSVDAPVAFTESFGTDELSMQVWSAVVADEAMIGSLGEPEAGNVWVSMTTATKDNGSADLVDTDVAPVLRTADGETAFEAVSPRENTVPLSTKGQSYSFQWAFQVPQDKAVAADLVVCLDDADGKDLGCSAIAK